MNPLHLVARNYRCFADLDLALPEGCVAVIGENGAGKSSIVNAIDLTIFGARSLADLLTDTADGEELLLELELEHAGELYRIRRTFSARGRGKTTLDFEHGPEPERVPVGLDSWTPLTRGSAKETQELIEATIGLSRETFRASAFLAQGDGAAFTEAKPTERKEILSAVLGLNKYEALKKRAHDDRRTFEVDLQTLDGKTAAAREQVAQKPAIVAQRDAAVEAETELADRIADLEREHGVLAERFQEAREHGARRQAAEAELREATTAVAQLTQRATAADTAVRAIAAATSELDALPAAAETAGLEQQESVLVAAVQEHQQLKVARDAAVLEERRLEAQRTNLMNAADSARSRAHGIKRAIADIEAAPNDEAKCDRCQQALAGASRTIAIDSMLKDMHEQTDEENRLRNEAFEIIFPFIPPEPAAPPVAELDQVRGQLRAIREAAARRAQLEERIRQLEPQAAARPAPDAITAALAEVTKTTVVLEGLQPADLDEITRQGTAVRERLDANRGTLAQQRDLRARLDERLTQIAAAEDTLAAAAGERDRLQVLVDVVLVLERAFGRDGIPALIVENSAIPYLETEATQVLSLLGGKTAAARVELRTQAELKSGDGLRDTLDIVVVTEHDSERSYENWSGGEQMRINLALRVALAKLLAHGGAASGIFVIDEPDGLDATGKAALIDILRDMQGRGIERVYLISHDADLRDSFDTTLSVVDGRVDSGLEAVPA